MIKEQNIDITVKIRMNDTGEVRNRLDTAALDEQGKPQLFGWQEGNFSCDCNRSLFWFDFKGDVESPCGEEAFSIQVIDAKSGEIYYDEFHL